MRVLLASQYFTPEVTAAAPRAHAFAAGLAARGHDVEVISEVPSHPEGVVHPGFSGARPVTRRNLDGFRVSYVGVHVTQSKRARARVANYGTYAASAVLQGSLMRRPDAVVATSPPLPVGWVGSALAARHRVPWVLDVRDLWPEVAVLVGELAEGSRAARAAERLERRLYRSATEITTVTHPFAEKIAERGGRGKISVIPNGTTPTYLDAADESPGREELAPAGAGFVWTYAGNMGLAQGLEAAVDAAGELGEGFELLMLGSGPMLESLRERAAGLPAGRVVFADAVPPERAARIMRASDALLVPLAADPGLAGFVPSKLFDCCAVGRPVVVATPGEANRLASEAGAAMDVPPGDPAAIAGAVRRLASDEGLREKLAAAGRSFAARYERDRGVTELERAIERAVERGR